MSDGPVVKTSAAECRCRDVRCDDHLEVFPMTKQYSIAEARGHLPGIVHEVEHNGPVELTRRGKRVAVVLSIDEYERLTGNSDTFWDRLQAYRRRMEAEGVEI